MPKYPKPIGPYSVYKIAGDFVYLAGQIGINPDKGSLEEGLEAQTERVLTNITHILSEIGLTLEHVVKTTIFLKNMEDFPRVNEIYGRYFKDNPPARSTVAVKDLPKGALVEIEVIAYIPSLREEILKGLSSFKEKSFFESHEYWEKAWRRLDEPFKSWLRALIHLDAALLKVKERNVKGAKIHFERAHKLLKEGELKDRVGEILKKVETLDADGMFSLVERETETYIKEIF